MQKSKTKIILASVAFVACLTPNAKAEDFPNDLLLNPNSVYFSKETPIVDSELRIYASVTNSSKSDLSGTVKFYDEKMQTQVGVDQPISVLAGSTDDVFVDFKIKEYGEHPIAVRVVPWKTEGDNQNNNKVIKNIFVDYDTDGDGVPNNSDSDDDNDGCKDSADALPFDPSDCLDTDGDKIGNKLDPDDDNDELLDLEEVEKGTDALLYDTDGDGVNDKDDLYPLDKTRSADADGDGIADENDNDDDNDGCLDDVDVFPFDSSECLDTDKDGIGNNKDEDDDNDGLQDSVEIDQTKTDPLLYDTDGDGINDKDDAFPLDPNESSDKDQDGLGDNADSNDENAGPIAVIYSNTLIAKVGEKVSFDATASLDSDGTVADYQWDFGDGTKAVGGELAEHAFDVAGIYQVKLTVFDNKNESRTNILEMTIKRNLLWAYLIIALGVLIVFMASLKKYMDQEED